MASLPVTGELNQETLHKMEQPRCGVADISENSPLNFVTGPRKWPKTLLTWRISTYSKTSKLTEFQQRDAIERGLNIWAKHTPLRFQYQTLGRADLNFKFGVRYHGDSDKFDGDGGVLAHATLPTDGEIHFDDEEMWLLGQEAQSKGAELYIVAAHEIGHALGLDHTKVQGALMAPMYVYSSNLQLHSDDISGIQFLYGKRFSRRKSFWWFLRK
ncbi:hypothetical protein CHS0354_041410 [Potamilus streckersoni]|uniref:Peptidase metallopeptidase domain-containing protein n=1 Tax=Potamilus streckersoni TaxID=2493646 RepID=A0AAE0W9X7_9BIVA|nr:hypothetical protein CHS0354_041410 [Potamilus streckersoni]